MYIVITTDTIGAMAVWMNSDHTYHSFIGCYKTADQAIGILARVYPGIKIYNRSR